MQPLQVQRSQRQSPQVQLGVGAFVSFIMAGSSGAAARPIRAVAASVPADAPHASPLRRHGKSIFCRAIPTPVSDSPAIRPEAITTRKRADHEGTKRPSASAIAPPMNIETE